MDILSGLILFLAAILGSSLNAVAGGGGFISYPSLIFCNVFPTNANAISTVALWPGNMASAKAYQNDIHQSRNLLLKFIISISVGGLLGAFLFMQTKPGLFSKLVPFFLLITWLLFVFCKYMGSHFTQNKLSGSSLRVTMLHLVIIFLIGIYGGYFGAGLGMILLTALSLIGLKSINEMNGIKVVLVSFNNGFAAITFIFSGIVLWQHTVIMLAGALIGGFYGAKLARKIKQEILQTFVMAIGAIITLMFFYKQYIN